MKTIIQVWTHKFKNSDRFSGLGDMIRGTVKLFELSKEFNFKLIVDIHLHIVSQFLSHTTDKIYTDIIDANKDNIIYIMNGELAQHIKEISNNNSQEIFYFFANGNSRDIYVSDECKIFMKNLLAPTKDFKDYFDKKIMDIPFKNFNILHYRVGDLTLVKKQRNDCNYLEHIKYFKEKNDVFISDSNELKASVKKKHNIFSFNIDPSHVGVEKNTQRIKDTLFEFTVISRSSKIKTYSSYFWISGFVFWTHKIYDIPLVSLKNLTVNKILIKKKTAIVTKKPQNAKIRIIKKKLSTKIIGIREKLLRKKTKIIKKKVIPKMSIKK